jgi:hypothetical protein
MMTLRSPSFSMFLRQNSKLLQRAVAAARRTSHGRVFLIPSTIAVKILSVSSCGISCSGSMSSDRSSHMNPSACQHAQPAVAHQDLAPHA